MLKACISLSKVDVSVPSSADALVLAEVDDVDVESLEVEDGGAGGDGGGMAADLLTPDGSCVMPRLFISWAKLATPEVVVVDELPSSVELDVSVASLLVVVSTPAVVLVSDGAPDGGGPGGGLGGMPPGPPIAPELPLVLPPVVPDEFIICAMTAAITAPISAEFVETSTV